MISSRILESAPVAGAARVAMAADQALERAAVRAGSEGREALAAALAMANRFAVIET